MTRRCRLRPILILVLAMALPALEAPAQRPDARARQRALMAQQRTQRLLQVLEQRVEHVEFDDPFSDVLQWFKDRGVRNLIINWNVLAQSNIADPGTQITLSLDGVSLGELLGWVLELASDQAALPEERLTFHITRGILRIAPRAYFDRRLLTRTYYVEDLLQRVTANELAPFLAVGSQFPYVRETRPVVASGAAAQAPVVDVINTGSTFGPGAPGMGGIGIGGGGIGGGGGGAGGGGGGSVGLGVPDFQQIREEELQRLVDMLRSLRPQTWDSGGGLGTIAPFGERLVITQTVEMHEIIGGTFIQMSQFRGRRIP